MKRSTIVLTCGAAALVVLAVWAQGGELNPPAGPVAPTMTSLAQLSADIAALRSSMGAGGSPKRVIHGAISLASGESQKTQEFSPAIDPAKSMVVLSPVVHMASYTNPNAAVGRNGACLADLTATNLTVMTDAYTSVARKVSFQIIEYP